MEKAKIHYIQRVPEYEKQFMGICEEETFKSKIEQITSVVIEKMIHLRVGSLKQRFVGRSSLSETYISPVAY